MLSETPIFINQGTIQKVCRQNLGLFEPNLVTGRCKYFPSTIAKQVTKTRRVIYFYFEDFFSHATIRKEITRGNIIVMTGIHATLVWKFHWCVKLWRVTPKLCIISPYLTEGRISHPFENFRFCKKHVYVLFKRSMFETKIL